MEWKQLTGMILHGNIYLWWWWSHQSLACKGSCTLRFCGLGKMNQNPTSTTVRERQLEWFRDSSQYRTLDTNDGQPMEFEWNLFQDSLHGFPLTTSKNSWAKRANQNNSKDESSSCRCSMTSYGESKTMKRNVLLIPHLCHNSQNKNQQDVGHSSDLGQKQSSIPLTKKDQEENGIESLKWWWSNSEKADTQFSEQRVRSHEERSKAKEVDNYRYTSVPMRERLKLFRRIISVNQLSIYGAIRFVWRIQKLSNKNRETCFWHAIWSYFRASRLIDNDTHIFDWNSCTRNSNAEAQRTSGKASTTRSIDKDLYWCRTPEKSWSRTILHDKTYWRVLPICKVNDMSRVFVPTRWQINWPERLDSREHQNWTRIGSYNLLPTR